jgi:diguanylate cyclase (GGDEF)-like protein/PAS domain S-box-containing protein
MLKDFVLNATLLISSFSIMGQIFRNKPLKVSSPLSTKLYWGIFYGVLGNILMLFSMKVNLTTIADLRHLAIVLPAAFGGFIPALIAAFFISLGRLLLFTFDSSVPLVCLSTIIIGIVCGAISKLNYRPTVKAFLMNIAGLGILTVVFIAKVNDPHVLNNLLIFHISASLIGGFLAYHFAVYIDHTSEVQRELKWNVIKLKETEERFRLLAEYSSDLITMHTEKNRYIYLSPAVKEIIQFEYPELLGRKMTDFIHLEDKYLVSAAFNKALTEGFADASFRYKSKHDDYVWIESTMKSVQFLEDGTKRVIMVSRNITQRKETEQKMQEANELLNRLSYMDGLTGIANRRYFDETLTKVWESSSLVTLLLFDIDFFKKYNDTYGHLAGDHCLQAISQAILSKVVKNTNYTFCRYGGEEFALIIPSEGMDEGEKAAKLIQQTVHRLGIPHESSEVAEIVTLSIGIASSLPNDSTKPQELILNADAALYSSKERGRNRITLAG